MTPTESRQMREIAEHSCHTNIRHSLRLNRLMQHNANVHQNRLDCDIAMRMAANRAAREAKAELAKPAPEVAP